MNIQKNEKGFAFIEFYSGSHGHQRTRIWVHENFIRQTPYRETIINEVLFPIREARIVKTEKGGMVLRPAPAPSTVYLVEISSGYRGSSSLTNISEGEIVAQGDAFHSGQGSLGSTAWAVVNGGESITVQGRRTGRRIDKNEISLTLYADGRKEEVIEREIEQLLGGK